VYISYYLTVTGAPVPSALKRSLRQLALRQQWGRGEISYAERGTQMELCPYGNE